MECPFANAHLPHNDPFVDDTELTIHLFPGYDLDVLPIKAKKLRDWWETNRLTANHAKFCLPLTMGASVGYYLLSPATFDVEWSGNEKDQAVIEILEPQTHGKPSKHLITNHSATGSFTIQTQFVAKTKKPGDFIMICDYISGERKPYNFMGACIEGWWNQANFGLVGIINKPGKFTVYKGEPLAHMFVLKAGGANAPLNISTNLPPDHIDWSEKRCRHGKWKDWVQPGQDNPIYAGKDLDYLKGRMPDQTPTEHHVMGWKTQVINPDPSKS